MHKHELADKEKEIFQQAEKSYFLGVNNLYLSSCHCRVGSLIQLLLACPGRCLVLCVLITGFFPSPLGAQTSPLSKPINSPLKPAVIAPTAQTSKVLILSEDEQRWLAKHQTIRLGINHRFEPIEFIDDQDNYAGIAADYVKLLSQRLGVKIQIISDINRRQALDLAQEGEIDMFAAITPNRDRKRYLQFTRPYFRYPIVIYTSINHPLIPRQKGLGPKKVLIVEDQFMQEVARQYYPNLDPINVKSTLEGLLAVSEERADAFIGDLANVSFEIYKHELTNLKIAPPARFESHGHSFAVRKDWPELVSMINKVMDTVSPEEHLYLKNKWVQIEVRKNPRYWFWIALGAAGLVLFFFISSTVLRKQVKRQTMELRIKNTQLVNENTERRSAEQALISSEQRLTQFFHATFEIVLFLENGQIMDANPATAKVLGYGPEEIVGKNILQLIEANCRQKVSASISQAVVKPYEANIITKAGTAMPFEIHPTNIELNGRQILVVSLHDITERKKNEHIMQHAYALLESRVAARTVELSLANTKLQDLDRLKSLFIASVSHELRTPLNSIIGFSGLMKQGSFGELNPKYTDYIGRINHSGLHLLSLITDIIDISKIESRYVEVDLSDFELAQLVHEAVKNLGKLAQDKGLFLDFTVPKGLQLPTDRRRLLQCLLNFISNAIKYSEQGQIWVTAELKANDIVLSVSDTGIGVRKADMEQLFEAFERIDSHMRVKAGGTGLGLYLTEKIATELLHGEVGANSKFGEGSTFWIKIPRDISQQDAVSTTAKDLEKQK